MNLLLRTLGLLCFLLAGQCFGAITTYTYTISSSLSYITIYQSTHGVPSPYNIGVAVYDGSGNKLDSSLWNASVLGGGDVYIVFTPSVSSGKIKILGSFDNATTNDRDFKVTRHANNQGNYNVLKVCDTCTTNDYVRHTWSSKKYVAVSSVSFTHGSSPDDNNYTAYLWLEGGKIKIGVANGVTGTSSDTSNFVIVYNVTSMPTGAGIVPLGSSTWYAGSGFSAPSDWRP